VPINLDSCITGIFVPGNIGASSGLPPIVRVIPPREPGIIAATVIEVATAADHILPMSISQISEPAAAADAPVATITSSGQALDGIANLTGAWSLSRDLVTSFVGGTRYTKSGTDIITLEDQSGNNRDFTDGGSATRRPTETTAFPASRLCADFDGSSDFLSTVAISDLIANSSGAMVISLIIDAVTINDATSYSNHGVMADSAAYMGLYARNFSGVTFYAYNWDGSADQPSTTGAVGTAYVLMWRHHGGNVYVSLNGGTEVSVASGNTQSLSGTVNLGTGSGGACNMKVAEIFTTSNGGQTAALATAIANMKTHVGA